MAMITKSRHVNFSLILLLSITILLSGIVQRHVFNQEKATAGTNSIAYTETEAESYTKSTTYQDKATLTITTEVACPYLVVATAELKGSSDSYSVYMRMTIDGSPCAEMAFEPEERGITYSTSRPLR